jgi:hypothetical protein
MKARSGAKLTDPLSGVHASAGVFSFDGIARLAHRGNSLFFDRPEPNPRGKKVVCTASSQ